MLPWATCGAAKKSPWWTRVTNLARGESRAPKCSMVERRSGQRRNTSPRIYSCFERTDSVTKPEADAPKTTRSYPSRGAEDRGALNRRVEKYTQYLSKRVGYCRRSNGVSQSNVPLRLVRRGWRGRTRRVRVRGHHWGRRVRRARRACARVRAYFSLSLSRQYILA